MESLKQNKTLLVLFFISLIAFVLYQFGGSLNLGISSNNTIEVADDAATADILRLLGQMQQAQINSDLFSSSAWTNLIDHSVALPTDAPGRPELFSGTFQINQTVSQTVTPSR